MPYLLQLDERLYWQPYKISRYEELRDVQKGRKEEIQGSVGPLRTTRTRTLEREKERMLQVRVTDMKEVPSVVRLYCGHLHILYERARATS
jgi:hypothetical protein